MQVTPHCATYHIYEYIRESLSPTMLCEFVCGCTRACVCVSSNIQILCAECASSSAQWMQIYFIIIHHTLYLNTQCMEIYLNISHAFKSHMWPGVAICLWPSAHWSTTKYSARDSNPHRFRDGCVLFKTFANRTANCSSRDLCACAQIINSKLIHIVERVCMCWFALHTDKLSEGVEGGDWWWGVRSIFSNENGRKHERLFAQHPVRPDEIHSRLYFYYTFPCAQTGYLRFRFRLTTELNIVYYTTYECTHTFKWYTLLVLSHSLTLPRSIT